VLLPLKALTTEQIGELHFSDSHWTPKVDSTSGQILIDASNGPDGFTLKSKESKEKGIERFGKATCPTIKDILSDWIELCQRHSVVLSECEGWKDDIDSAFPQLNMDPASAMLLATMVDRDLLFINSSGSFGTQHLPMAWGVVSRAIERGVSKVITGVSRIYVDDLNSLSLPGQGKQDQLNAHQVIRSIVNPTAVSMSKSVSPCKVLDILGWTINLHDETIRPTTKGIEKLFYAFTSVDTSKRHNLQVYQCLAGLSHHYSLGILSMSAFVSPLYNMCSVAAKHSRFPSSAAKFCIEVWRIMSILLFSDPTFLNVHIVRITGHCLKNNIYISDYVTVISDASPWKLGAGIYSQDRQSLIAYTSFPVLFTDIDNRYQNIREYLGRLLCLFLVRVTIPSSPVMLKWINDNVAALKWATTSRCTSLCGQAANIIMSWFQIHSGINVTITEHISGINMGIIDDISRDVMNTDLDAIPFIDLQPPFQTKSNQLRKLFTLCDPTIPGPIIDHHERFKEIHSSLNKFFDL